MPMAWAILGAGALAAGSGIFGSMGSSSNAAAQAEAQRIQQQQANFKNEWAHAANQRNQLRAFQANLERNILIEKGANKDRALAEYYLDKNFLNQKSTLSKQTSTTNAQFISTTHTKGLSTSSNTARALLRQNMTSMSANLTALRQNHRSQWNDITNQQNQKLSQRQFTFQEQAVFLPQTGGIADASSAMMTSGIIQAGFTGASAALSAYMMYGMRSGPGAAGANGGVVPPPAPVGYYPNG